jgi:hypothetical protein
MRFEKRANGEWAVVPTGSDSITRRDGRRGAVVVGPDGQVLDVFERAGKIEVEPFVGPMPLQAQKRGSNAN